MIVHLQGVRVRKGGRTVLEIPALALEAEGVTAVLGPNGAGKSTLLRALAGLDRALDGTIEVGGGPGRPAIAMAFQSPVFLRGSVRDNLELALRLHRVATPERGRRIARAAELLGIEGLLERDARRLSGGEAQRANVARALALEADLTLLDEPLAGLDEPSADELRALLPRALRASRGSVLFVTHDRDEAARVASRAIVLLGGRLAAQGPLPDLFRAPPTPAVAAFLGFTLLPFDSRLVAVGPGGLGDAPGEPAFDFVVEAVFELPYGREATGTIGGLRATAHLASPAAPGDVVRVAAVEGRFVHFP